MSFWEKSVESEYTLWAKIFQQNLSILLCFRDKQVFATENTQKFKMAAKRENFFVKSRQYTLQLPYWSNILLKLLYLTPFPK